MSTTGKTFWAVACDYPGCEQRDDGGEYTYWDDPQHAIDSALDGDWYQESDASAVARGIGPRLFCGAHEAHIVWLSDEDPGPMTSGDEEDARVLTLPDGERVVLA